MSSKINHLDGCDSDATEIGCIDIGHGNGVITTAVKNVTGRHSVFFIINTDYTDRMGEMFKDRALFELDEFVFMK